MPRPDKAPRRRAPLTRDDVLREALRCADAGGLRALSMRKLAQAVKVEAMSLYHHFANKDALLDAMVDAVFGEIAAPDPGEDWKPAMRRRAVATRTALGQHRWAVGLMDSRAAPGPNTLRHHDAVIGCLRNAGFSLADAASAFSTIDSFIYGFVLQELSLPFETQDELHALAADIFDETSAAAYPNLSALTTEHILQPGYDPGDAFDFGLDLILDGLERSCAT